MYNTNNDTCASATIYSTRNEVPQSKMEETRRLQHTTNIFWFIRHTSKNRAQYTFPSVSTHTNHHLLSYCSFIIPKDTRQQTHYQMTVTYKNDSSYHHFHLETFEYIRSFSDCNYHIFGHIRRKMQTHPVACTTERLEHIANDCIQNNGTKSRQSYQLHSMNVFIVHRNKTKWNNTCRYDRDNVYTFHPLDSWRWSIFLFYLIFDPQEHGGESCIIYHIYMDYPIVTQIPPDITPGISQ